MEENTHLSTANIASGVQITDFGKVKRKTNKRQRTLNLWQSYWPVMFPKLWDYWQVFTFLIPLIWFSFSASFCYVIRYTIEDERHGHSWWLTFQWTQLKLQNPSQHSVPGGCRQLLETGQGSVLTDWHQLFIPPCIYALCQGILHFFPLSLLLTVELDM